MYCIEYWTTTLVIEGFIRANELCKQNIVAIEEYELYSK